MAGMPPAFPPGMALDAAGHALYARVTALPSFTLVRAESELLRTGGREMLAAAGNPSEIVDLSATTVSQPASLLANAARYVVVDLSLSVLHDVLGAATANFPAMESRGIVGEPVFGLEASERSGGRRMILLLGSLIGRYDPAEARLQLAQIRRSMLPGDTLLMGVDTLKEERRLHDAYDDPTGVFGAYVRNSMRRANREVGTDFQSADWQTVVDVQSTRGCVEIRLEARRALSVSAGRIGGHWSFLPGESIVAERNYKPSEGQAAATALAAGFSIAGAWTDCGLGYAVFLLSLQS
jgi:L-histidine N-alpha-methyltransferase